MQSRSVVEIALWPPISHYPPPPRSDGKAAHPREGGYYFSDELTWVPMLMFVSPSVAPAQCAATGLSIAVHWCGPHAFTSRAPSYRSSLRTRRLSIKRCRLCCGLCLSYASCMRCLSSGPYYWRIWAKPWPERGRGVVLAVPGPCLFQGIRLLVYSVGAWAFGGSVPFRQMHRGCHSRRSASDDRRMFWLCHTVHCPQGRRLAGSGAFEALFWIPPFPLLSGMH